MWILIAQDHFLTAIYGSLNSLFVLISLLDIFILLCWSYLGSTCSDINSYYSKSLNFFMVIKHMYIKQLLHARNYAKYAINFMFPNLKSTILMTQSWKLDTFIHLWNFNLWHTPWQGTILAVVVAAENRNTFQSDVSFIKASYVLFTAVTTVARTVQHIMVIEMKKNKARQRVREF